MRRYGFVTGTLSIAFAMILGVTSFAEVSGKVGTAPVKLVGNTVEQPVCSVEISANEYNVLTSTASGLTLTLAGKGTLIKTVKDNTLKASKTNKKSSSTKTKVKSKKKKTKAASKKKAKKASLKSLGTYKITAYCPCAHCCGKETGITASGTKATAGRTIAADTSVLPFGTKVVINGHTYTVEDRGGAIKSNKIDIYFNSHQEALNFGVQYLEVFIEQ